MGADGPAGATGMRPTRAGGRLPWVARGVGCIAAAALAVVGVAGCGGIAAVPGIAPGSAAARGESLFDSAGCDGCHMVDGQGGTVGPDLSKVGTLGKTATYTGDLPVKVPGVVGPVYTGRDWFVLHTECPSCATPGSPMPAFTDFTPRQYLDLAAFLAGLGVTEK